jgi:quercetin dioxygenase-like cupin family protein
VASITATIQGSGGKFTFVEATENAGETPFHFHRIEDEAFWVLERDIEFEIGGKMIKSVPGSAISVPRASF